MYIVIRDGFEYNRIDTQKISLPYEYKGIEILNEVDGLHLHLKKGFRFDDGTADKELVIQEYLVRTTDRFKDIRVYVYKSDMGFDDFAIYKKLPFIYAANRKAPVCSKDPYLKDAYLYLKDRPTVKKCRSTVVLIPVKS